jgi:hypothetical protein
MRITARFYNYSGHRASCTERDGIINGDLMSRWNISNYSSGTGGTGAYQYQLNSGGYQSSNTFNVVAGTYTITIQDANNCTSSTVTTITEPTLLGLNLSSTTILCNGGQSTITATANGGTTAYQYSLNGAAYQSGNTFTVGVGTYTISTQDANGCTASSVINIIQPTLLQITNLSSTIPTCVPAMMRC